MIEFKHRFFSSMTLLILDFIWISTYMGGKYNILVNKIQNSKMEVKTIYAVFAYSLMLLGLNIFVLPKIDTENVKFLDCLIYGFLFGVILYGVYDFTCAAVLKDWDIKLAFIDVLWGGFVYFISCFTLKII